MDDLLTTEIADMAARLKLARDEVKTLEVRLEALEFAANARPLIDKLPLKSKGLSRAEGQKGRRSGAISMAWRSVLSELVSRGNAPFDTMAVSVIADKHGVTSSHRSIIERINKFASSGYLVRMGRDFRVSDSAIAKFDLKMNEPPSGVTPGGPDFDKAEALDKPASSSTPHPHHGE